MFKNSQFPKWAVVFIVIQISLLSVTLVSAHGGNTALIHACVNNTSGELKIVGANASCPNNYRALDWNIQGPAGQQGLIGPMGPIGPQGLQGERGLQGEQGLPGLSGLQGEQGPQGLQGQQGIQGPAGISGLEVVEATSWTQVAARIDVESQCPDGKQVLGGGYSSAGNNSNISFVTNAPFGSSWFATAVTNDYPNVRSGWSVRAFAICANVAP